MMTTGHSTVNVQLAVLLLSLGLGLAHSAFALEALSDESLSQQTGEGIAILPENVKMVFQKAEDTLSTAQNKARVADRSFDTGLIRVIPVGPLSATATAAGAKKPICIFTVWHSLKATAMSTHALAILDSTSVLNLTRGF